MTLHRVLSPEKPNPNAGGGGAGGVAGGILYEKKSQNLSGNEVYYSACSLLVILKNSCSQLHFQKGFHLIFSSHNVGQALSSEHGTDKAVKARFWSRLEPFSVRTVLLAGALAGMLRKSTSVGDLFRADASSSLLLQQVLEGP